MARIFICHASEDSATAERIHLALVGLKHKVFYDKQSLPPGGDYHSRIEAAIRCCHVFIFLATRQSLAPGRFTLNELSLAQQRWPSPNDRVLPVTLDGLAPSELPNYLQATTVLAATGNTPAAVRLAVEDMLKRQRQRLNILVRLAFAVAVLAVGFVATWVLVAGTRQAKIPMAHAPAPQAETSEKRASRLVNANIPAARSATSDSQGPLYTPPSRASRRIDGCIASDLFPEAHGTQCAMEAQRIVATVFCRSQGYREALAYRAQMHTTISSAYKLSLNEASQDNLQWQWIPSDTSGFWFEEIECQ